MAALSWDRGTLLVRTDFSRPQRWDTLLRALHTPSDEGFTAAFETVDDPEWRDATAEQLIADAPDWALFIVADAVALSSPELPALVISIEDGTARQLRVTPAVMWAVENNLSIANMDWEDFASAADSDGIYRGRT